MINKKTTHADVKKRFYLSVYRSKNDIHQYLNPFFYLGESTFIQVKDS